MSKGEVLTPKESMFCEHYARSSSETYNKKKLSALTAGYAESSAAEIATRLTNKKEIAMARIREIYAENVTRDTPIHLSDLENHRLLALKYKKIDAANVAKKLQCQILGILPSDASATATIEQVKLTKLQEEQARKFAKWSVLEDLEKGEQELGTSLINEATENL